jgi:serine/threonine-protein kinase
MPHPVGDRNLLFGILALQMDFVRREDLIAGMNAWVLDKTRPLGQILCAQGVLSSAHQSLLNTLVEEHLKIHGNDIHQSLASAGAARSLCLDLQQVADADVQASLARLDPGPLHEATHLDSPVSRNGSRYRVLRPHARGGLGEVFVAEDTELHREVALKEIQPQRADDPHSRGRFVLEAEITGGLEHPGIVPVYGLGIYPDGRPYYAMRFIRGNSFKEAIESFHGLTSWEGQGPGAGTAPVADAPGSPGFASFAFRQLLSRFIAVCNAVAYAHSRGVLHRDLKPSNIMLGRFGETLIVDWGLAKAGTELASQEEVESEATVEPALRPASGSDAMATQPGAVLGTPAFMSPEQAAGRLEDLGPASDIFSLGSTLYVLLTGRKPFDAADRDALVAQVQQGHFLRPRQIRRDTPPALDAICCKAMALRPTDRYPTALDLAADLEHWLADEPVSAYPEPWTVQAGRWARRHRTALSAAAVFLVSAVVALSASTALIWREQRRTAEQKQLAEQNYALSRDQSFTIIDLIESSEAELAAIPAQHATRKELLKAASRACRQYLTAQPEDLELRKRAAKVYRFTANVQRLTNETAAAGSLYLESIRLLETLTEQLPDEAAWREKLSDTVRDHAQLQVKMGQLKEAAASLRQAIALAEKLRDEDPEQSGYRRSLALCLVDLSGIQNARGEDVEAEKSARQAVDLFRRLVEMPPGQRHPYELLFLAAALNQVAVTERSAGRLDAALTTHKEALKQIQALVENKPNQINVADIQYFEALCRFEQSRTWAKKPQKRGFAVTNLLAVATQWGLLARDYPRIPMYREDQAFAHLVRGQVEGENSQAADARADLEKARALLEELVKAYPELPANRANLGKAYAGLARLTRAAGNQEEADTWYAKAVKELSQAVAQSPDNAQDRSSLDEVRAERDRK